jgi:hypothetical protein
MAGRGAEPVPLSCPSPDGLACESSRSECVTLYCFLSEAGGGPAGGRGPSSGRRPVETGADGLAASSAGPTGGSGGVLGAGGLDASQWGSSSSLVQCLDDGDVGGVMGAGVVGALVGASFGETGVGKGTRVRETLDGAGFGEGLWGPRSIGRRSSTAVPGNGGVVGTGDGAGDGSVGANDDSGPSAGVGFATSVDDDG